MSDLQTDYLACWNETDPAARRALIERHFSEGVQFTDPLGETSGRDGVDAAIAAAQGQFPGFVFTPHGGLDQHHQQARFAWGLGPAGSEPLVVGFDVVVLDDDGRIDQVLGFLDKVPSA